MALGQNEKEDYRDYYDIQLHIYKTGITLLRNESEKMVSVSVEAKIS